ncbi:hypothetical protein J7E52_14405, partial [Bacillus sp. ISL-34]|uniref:hypothetical protein n=1 Tax=Bacillus sp. ISL-34 TaxID=2819121 RepID=UPI001BEA8B1F
EVFGFLYNGPNNTQATTVSWCTSRPAHRSIIASVGESPQKKINNTYDSRFVTKFSLVVLLSSIIVKRLMG